MSLTTLEPLLEDAKAIKMDLAIEGTYEAVTEHLQIFMSNDKA
ncbi:hypothetical protein [Pelosinus fermentans]|uniref:Uncharacterized protein n=1 Tax=Pelosinus fermentans JBW45 TaxID=1192197 RepID=I9NQ66_9FIRM|nr:hypothetical protein [Pelosinus fermentans]AJQ28307.1 hypothetical protein JBW_02964 [Pelosinus fermentans JBW45]